MVAGEPEFGVVLHDSGQGVQIFLGQEPALVVALLGPGIGEQHENPPDGGVGQARKQKTRVVVEDPDIGQTVALDAGQQGCHSIDERLASDHADGGMEADLFRQVLAGAEADLEPDVLDGSREKGREVGGRAANRGGYAQARQKIFDQCLAALAQRVAAAPPMPAETVAGIVPGAARQLTPNAERRPSTRLMRSQEKPPSGSGARPK